MNQWEFSFENNPAGSVIDGLRSGGRVCAVQLLTVLEGSSDEAAEDALQQLLRDRVTLDIAGLPKHTAAGEAAIRLKREEQLAAGGDLLTGLEETDPLRLYLEELAQIPACGDMALLAEDAARGDEAAQVMLSNLMLPFVVEAAKQYTGYGVLLLDLIQEGSMGMWQGILNWNGDGNFESDIQWWIRQSMAGLIFLQARSNGVSQKLKQALEDYKSVDEQLLGELGRNPMLEEIAQRLHMTLEEAAAVAEMMDAVKLVDRTKAPVQAKEDPEEDQAVEDTAYFQMRQRIGELLSNLPEQDVKLLTLRFGLEGGLPMSPADVGKKLGLTPEEVVAKEAAALAMLRNNG